MCFRSTTARAAGSPEPCVSVSCMEEPRPRPVVSASVRQRHGQNRIRVDSCWCALRFMSVLREEKFANGTDTGSRHAGTCSWPEINTVRGAKCATACAAPGWYHKLPCRAAAETRCSRWASCHARLIRGGLRW